MNHFRNFDTLLLPAFLHFCQSNQNSNPFDLLLHLINPCIGDFTINVETVYICASTWLLASRQTLELRSDDNDFKKDSNDCNTRLPAPTAPSMTPGDWRSVSDPANSRSPPHSGSDKARTGCG
mmetsp:Transcript_18496/g.39940  ORF Transcript_18496/g.39940 Transcript_18496/m.39940 type:complete len:123 (+) Transcript_18496:1285-1653(+)